MVIRKLAFVMLTGFFLSEVTVIAEEGKVVVEKEVIDLGSIAKNESREVEFTIYNGTDKPLSIIKASPTCGCTVVKFDKTIEPGKTGIIKAKFDSTGLKLGKARSKIIVETDNPYFKKIELSIEANIEEYIKILPPYSRWIVYKGAKSGTTEHFIFDEQGEKFNIVDVKSDYKYVKYSYNQEERLGKDGWILTLTFDPQAAPIGPIKGSIQITTDHKKQKKAILPISGFVRPAFFIGQYDKLTPKDGNFGTFTISEGKPRIFRYVFNNFTEIPIEELKATTDIKGVEVVTKEISKGHKYLIKVIFDSSNLKEGKFKGLLTLEFKHPLRQKVILPIKGEIDIAKTLPTSN